MARAPAQLRLRYASSAAPSPPPAPGELEPEILALIRAIAEAEALADHNAAQRGPASHPNSRSRSAAIPCATQGDKAHDQDAAS